MSRQEIANYLAVAVETISRLFTDLQRRGVLEVDRRFVRILSLDALHELAHEGRALGVSSAS
jgi:CRP/FNR family transcriptional regulator